MRTETFIMYHGDKKQEDITEEFVLAWLDRHLIKMYRPYKLEGFIIKPCCCFSEFQVEVTITVGDKDE